MRARNFVVVALPLALVTFACNAILGIEDLVDPGAPDASTGETGPTETGTPDGPTPPTDGGMTPCDASPATDPCVVVVAQTSLDGGPIYPTWPITFDESYIEGMANPPGPAPRYDAAAPDTVFEEVTGLTWQKSYLPGGPFTYPQAQTACATLGAGWRLPTRVEEATLESRKLDADAGKVGLPTVFNGAGTNTWTSTSQPNDPGQEIGIYQHEEKTCVFGGAKTSDVDNSKYAVRCVKGAVKNATFHVSKSADRVYSVDTNLEWERTGVIVGTRAEALKHCTALGMRIPVLQEIYGIVDTRTTKLFQEELFPSRPAGGIRALYSQSYNDLFPLADGGTTTRWAAVGLTIPYGDHTGSVDNVLLDPSPAPDGLLRCVAVRKK